MLILSLEAGVAAVFAQNAPRLSWLEKGSSRNTILHTHPAGLALVP